MLALHHDPLLGDCVVDLVGRDQMPLVQRLEGVGRLGGLVDGEAHLRVALGVAG